MDQHQQQQELNDPITLHKYCHQTPIRGQIIIIIIIVVVAIKSSSPSPAAAAAAALALKLALASAAELAPGTPQQTSQSPYTHHRPLSEAIESRELTVICSWQGHGRDEKRTNPVHSAPLEFGVDMSVSAKDRGHLSHAPATQMDTFHHISQWFGQFTQRFAAQPQVNMRSNSSASTSFERLQNSVKQT